MARIILGNVGTDAMAPPAPLLSDEFLRTNAASAKRMIWLAKNDDVFINPTPVTQLFLDYVNSLKGGSNIVSLSTSSVYTTRPHPISKSDFAASSRLSKSLRLLASDTHVSCLEPYIADEVSMAIAHVLGDIPVMFSNQNVRASPNATRLLNDKAKFREFAPKLGVPIASGSICVSMQELVDAACRAIAVSDIIILKMVCHSGGDGNSVISKGIERSFQGAMRSVSVLEGDANSIRAAVREIGLVATENEPVIVEVYNENESSIGVHFDIGVDRVELVGVASILLNPGYGGAYWGKSLVDDLPSEVLAWCYNLGYYAKEIGYFGPLSVDIVKAKEIGFFACEVNGRHGGFSSVRAVSNSLGLETDIKNGERVVLSRNFVPIDIRFPYLVDLLKQKQLHYKSSDRSGAIVMVEGHDDKGPFDFAIFGGDLAQLRRIEASIMRLADGSY
ncbi:hypothetical protein DBIPINDM_003641 [Mesorhizobium sp. AR02]|uniref:preATP grasp domain-containing protein n=1 Tax=Mesorhizobium sp. AR02 TaxID=2865837 RepID=UPI0021607C32|nr:hypothetical protein [Mesorhizobium sp. AR02]UVK50476.1 hypothetical protein DBIPINDM_003641 [Mesorhizobium sp. AR02]